MNGEIRSFDFSGRSVRVSMGADGSPWFVAADSCKVLGLTNGRDVVAGFPDDEKGVADVYTLGGTQKMTIISEPGIYRLIFGSRKQDAEAFRRWVIHEVLPSIRKTGSFNVQPLIPQTLPEALRAYADALEEKNTLANKVQEMAPKAEFHDAVAVASDGQSVAEVAKVLGTGQNRLFRLLYENKVLIEETRLPFQEYLDRGYFRVIEQKPWADSVGQTHIPTKTLVTGKGLAWIQRKWFTKREEIA